MQEEAHFTVCIYLSFSIEMCIYLCIWSPLHHFGSGWLPLVSSVSSDYNLYSVENALLINNMRNICLTNKHGQKSD